VRRPAPRNAYRLTGAGRNGEGAKCSGGCEATNCIVEGLHEPQRTIRPCRDAKWPSSLRGIGDRKLCNRPGSCDLPDLIAASFREPQISIWTRGDTAGLGARGRSRK